MVSVASTDIPYDEAIAREIGDFDKRVVLIVGDNCHSALCFP